MNININNSASVSHPIIESILEAVRKTDPAFNTQNTNYIKKSQLRRSHNSDKPLMYMLFDELFGIDFKTFVKWHKKNGHKINHNLLMSKCDTDRSKDIFNLMHNTSNERASLHSLYKNNFVSLDILHCIERTDFTYEAIDDELVNLKMFYSNNKPDVDLIFHILRAMRYLFNKSNKYNKLDLTIIASSQKKMFDSDLFTPCNINSGSTYPNHSITIWRSEEIYKVLLHELIHFYGLDFFSDPNSQYYESLKNVVKIEGIDCINEAYTETLAVIINSVFCSYYKNHDHSNISDLINLEKHFLLFQVAKIIKLSKGKSAADLFKIKINQTTSVRSYFVYKMFLLFNMDKFLDFVLKHNYDISSKPDELCALIKESCDIFRAREDILNKIDEYMNIKTSDKWIYKTARMTANDIR